MHIDKIRDTFPDARIEIGEDDTVYVHAGGAYPLIFTKVEGITNLIRETYMKHNKKSKEVV